MLATPTSYFCVLEIETRCKIAKVLSWNRYAWPIGPQSFQGRLSGNAVQLSGIMADCWWLRQKGTLGILMPTRASLSCRLTPLIETPLRHPLHFAYPSNRSHSRCAIDLKKNCWLMVEQLPDTDTPLRRSLKSWKRSLMNVKLIRRK